MRNPRWPALALLALLVLPFTVPAAAQTSVNPQPGPKNSLTDVPGLEVGHYRKTKGGHLTGTTVILARDGAVGGVDVRGGGPGTRETELLDPRNLVQEAHAVVLSGGSAYGLDAAHGTMLWLEEQGIGYPVGVGADQIVPIVPSAILFDLGRGGTFKARPTHDFGYRAAERATNAAFAQGNAGAGAGASAGGLKGGIGTASVDLGNGIVVGAIVAINAAGQPFNPETCELYTAYLELGDEFGDYRTPKAADCSDSGFGSADAAAAELDGMRSLNTTIGLVATNFPMTKAQAQKMAGVAHDGMARAIRPVHTLFDGDTVFALSTGKGQISSECQTAAAFPADTVCTLLLNDIFSAGADAFARAVVHAMLNAKSTHGLTSYCDEFPTACGGEQAAAPDAGGVVDDIAHTPEDGSTAPAPVAATTPPPQALAAAGLQVTAMALLAVTALATGAVLVRQRRRDVAPPLA